MVEPNGRKAAADEADGPRPGWRFRIGMGLVVAGFLSPLGALLLPFTDLSTPPASR